MIDLPGYLNGFQVYESIALTKPKIVNRTWKERLLSWPWKPWKITKVIQIPSDQVIMNGNKLYMHPAMAQQLRESLPNEYNR